MSWLTAAMVVQHSNTAAERSRDVVDVVVDPDRVVSERLGLCAMATAADHLASAPSMVASSIFQPWGMKAPNITGGSAIAATLHSRPRGAVASRWRRRPRARSAGPVGSSFVRRVARRSRRSWSPSSRGGARGSCGRRARHRPGPSAGGEARRHHRPGGRRAGQPGQPGQPAADRRRAGRRRRSGRSPAGMPCGSSPRTGSDSRPSSSPRRAPTRCSGTCTGRPTARATSGLSWPP